MPFCVLLPSGVINDDDKALIKNLHQFKGYRLLRLLAEFPEIIWKTR